MGGRAWTRDERRPAVNADHNPKQYRFCRDCGGLLSQSWAPVPHERRERRGDWLIIYFCETCIEDFKRPSIYVPQAKQWWPGPTH